MKTETKKLPKSQLEISFELDADEFQKYIDKALEHLKKHIKVDGFRGGKVPLKIVEERVGAEALLMESGDMAVKDVYIKYIDEQKLEPVGNPEIAITKIAKGNPFLFKAVVTILPDVILPDYKEIAKSVKGQEIKVSEEEVQHSINYLQKSRAKFSVKEGAAEKNDFVEIIHENKDVNEGKPVEDKFVLGEGGLIPGFEENVIGMKAGEEKEFSLKFPQNALQKNLAGKEATFKLKMQTVKKMEVQELNDDFAKQFGAFDTLVALKESITENIKQERVLAEKQRKRAEVLNKIAEQSKFEIPEAVVLTEQERLFEDLQEKMKQHKITFEEYLSGIKKTEQEVKDTYKLEAEKRVKEFLILRQVGKQENVEVSDKEIDEEIEKTLKSYSKAEADKIDISRLREYAKGVIYNEKIFNLLENLSA